MGTAVFAVLLAATQSTSVPPAPALPPRPPSVLVSTQDDWYLFDNHRGDCSILSSYVGGDFVRVAYNYGRDDVVFSVGSRAWRSVESGRRYTVSVLFDNGAEYTSVPATGVIAEGDASNGILMFMNANDFLYDFAEAVVIQVKMGERRLGTYRLDRSRAAISRLRACSLASHRRDPPDPFANLPRQPSR